MSKLAAKLNAMKPKRKQSLWQGPQGDGPNGGISQSMISRWLGCPERFRVEYVEGWKPKDEFRPALEFGNLWHGAEEQFAAGEDWTIGLAKHAEKLIQQHPFQREIVEDWFEKVRIEFKEYVEHWSKHQDTVQCVHLLQEQVFDVPYVLPSGRTVRLRGKWDGVDLLGTGKNAAVYLFETKTKSTIDRKKLERQLLFDLQTLTYLIALDHYKELSVCGGTDNPLPESVTDHQIKGVRYNVIRRSAHVQRKKSRAEFEAYLGKMIRDDIKENPTDNGWFARWSCEVTATDVQRFKRTCLDPILENVCDDYEWWAYCHEKRADHFNGEQRKVGFPHHCPRTFRFPYGVYSAVAEGGFGDVDEFLTNGSTVGLHQNEVLFPELQEPQGK